MTNSSTETYFGPGNGRQLLDELKSAQRSVKVCSPYLSSETVSDLVGLHNRGVAVELITTDELGLPEPQMLIKQERIDDPEGRARKKTVQRLYLILFLMFSAFTAYLFFSIEAAELFTGALLTLIFGYASYFIFKKLLKTRHMAACRYTYKPIFPLRIVVKPKPPYTDSRAEFVHAKLYIIDERILWTGSLNFTQLGLFRNYEVAVRIDDPETVSRAVRCFGDLINGSRTSLELDTIGRAIHHESPY